MPHRLPAHLTTATNPWPLTCYIVTIYLGVLNITPLQQARSLGELVGATGVGTWAGGRASGGLFALVGAVLAMRALRQARSPLGWLWFEFVGCVLISATSTLYGVALIAVNGPFALMETTGLAAAFAIGGAWRAWQIPNDIRRWRRATTGNLRAKPAPLADPEG